MRIHDKLRTLGVETARIEKRLANAFDVAEEDGGGVDTIIRRFVVDPDRLILWDLMTFWQREMIRCHDAEAHFSAMVSSVLLNEAMLSLMCLMHEGEVVETIQFRRSTEKDPEESLNSVLQRWTLKQLINVASQLQWLPASLIDRATKDELENALNEVLNDPIPGEFSVVAAEWKQALEEDAGLAMLKLTQDLRNYVHPHRWMARQSSMESESFLHWCRIATKLSNEVHAALVFRNSQLAAIQREKELHAFMQIVNRMTPERYTAFIEAMRLRLSETVGMKIDPEFGINEMLNMFTNPGMYE
jgi:hypothetical protein